MAERELLKDEVSTLEQEAHMVLPGIQTLFGFQLVAVFNVRFDIVLSHREQHLHLAAMILVSISLVLAMAPAAYHRQAGHKTSRHFVRLSNKFLTYSLVTLAFAMTIDIFLISHVITGSQLVSSILTGFMLAVFIGVWFVFPWIRKLWPPL